MSDVVTQRRPMIDLDAFERALRTPSSTDPKDSDPINEIFRVIRGKEDATQSPAGAPAKSLDEVKTQPAARPGTAAQRGKLEGFAAFRPGVGGTKADGERPAVKIPLISGDFASIEAALLGKPQVETTEKSSEAETLKAAHAAEALSFLKEKPQKRSRVPIYAAAAFITVSLTAIAISSSYDRESLDMEEVAAVPDGVSGVAAPAGSAAVAAAQSADNLPLITPSEEVGTADNASTPLATAGVQDPAPTGSPAELRGAGPINQAQTDLVPPAPAVAPPPSSATAATSAVQAAELEQAGAPNVAPSAQVTTQVPEAQVPTPNTGRPKLISPGKGAMAKSQAHAKVPTPSATAAKPAVKSAALEQAPQAQASGLNAGKPKVASPAKGATAKSPAHAKAAKPSAPKADVAAAASQGQGNPSVAQPPSGPQAQTPASPPPAMSYVQGAVDAIGSTTAKLFNWIH